MGDGEGRRYSKQGKPYWHVSSVTVEESARVFSVPGDV